MPTGQPPRTHLTARIGRLLGRDATDASRGEASKILASANKEDDRVARDRSTRATAATRAGLASDENAARRTSTAETGPKPRPAISPPKPRAQTALGSGGTRAGLASDENADRPRPKATPATTSGRRSLATPSAGSDPSTFAKPIPSGGRDPSTFARPVPEKGKGLMGRVSDALAANRGRQQSMALARSIAEGKRG